MDLIKKNYVNGPINVIRLEGKINKINKVIYLFMDLHIPVSDETECSNIFSQDIQTYFLNNFINLNKIYDFFLEMTPSEQQEENLNYKDKYIEEVVKLFKKIFKYNKKKNLVSSLFHDVRIHFIDFRDYYFNSFYNDEQQLLNLLNTFKNNYDANILLQINDHLLSFKKYFQLLFHILKKPSDIKSKLIKKINNTDVDTINYISFKLKKKYNHAFIKKIMNDLINQNIIYVSQIITDIDYIIQLNISNYHLLNVPPDSLIENKNNYMYGFDSDVLNEISYNLSININSLSNDFMHFFAKLTDVFFLRRFLDKDYITNGIAYTGSAHSINFIHVLINYFDFKITNVSYSKIPIPQLNKKNISIKNLESFLYPPVLHQCSDLSSFPQHFL